MLSKQVLLLKNGQMKIFQPTFELGLAAEWEELGELVSSSNQPEVSKPSTTTST